MGEEQRNGTLTDDDKSLSNLVKNIYNNTNEDNEFEEAYSYREHLIQDCATFLNDNAFIDFSHTISKNVIGQDDLELLLAGIYNYISGIAMYETPSRINTLLAAPSGCGKTETYRSLKRYFRTKIPSLVVTLVDVSRITAEGFKGNDPGMIISELVSCNTGGYGIIFLDEFDKRISPQTDGSLGNMSIDVQGQLLTIIEGSIYKYRADKTTLKEIDSSLTMFIGCGSFNRMRLSKDEKNNRRTIGFIEQNERYDAYEEITRADMINAGCTYELLGRFTLIINYHKLNRDAILRIIEKARVSISKNLILNIKLTKQYIDNLVTISNGNFGCRLIHSMIMEAALRAYAESLKTKTCSCPVVIIKGENEYEICEPTVADEYEAATIPNFSTN